VRRGLERLLRERAEERGRVIEEARRVAEELRRRLGRATVLLYGSYARGDFNVWSDVDLLVVSEAFEGVSPLERLDAVIRVLPPRFEAVCLSLREARAQLRRAWWRGALEGAVVLVDDYGIASALRLKGAAQH